MQENPINMLPGGYQLRAILQSLTAFFAAGARPQTALAKTIMVVLVIKLIGIIGIKIFMFPGSTQPVVDAPTMTRVIGATASLPQ